MRQHIYSLTLLFCAIHQRILSRFIYPQSRVYRKILYSNRYGILTAYTPTNVVFQNYLLTFLFLLVSHQLLAQATYIEVLRVSNIGHNIIRENSNNWTVPAGGPYRIRITARGGRGGHLWRDNTPGTLPGIMVNGGRGAIVTSEFILASGSVLTAIPGYNGEIYTVPVGESATHNRKGTGGGGSSGVFWQNVGHLLVAGAGGGAGGAWINASHGGVDAVQSFVADNDAGAGGNGGSGFTTQYEWDGSGGGGANSNGFNNTTVTGGISFWGGGTGGRSGLNNEGASGGAGYSGGGGASTATNGGGGGGGGFAGGDGGRHQFFTSSPDGYGGEGGKSFVSTLGFNTTIGLGDYSDQAGSVVIELFARYSDFGTLIPSGIPDDLVFEYNQLQALYIATNGANWTNNTNWLTGGDMSQWYGVTLTPDGKSILKIELPNNNLTGGNIPDLNLPELNTLNLGNNSITGAIPNFNYLPQMQILKLNTNRFTGSVPNFAQCGQLSELNLAINQLTGSVPIFPIPWITHIDLGLNQLTGNIPSTFSNNYLTFFSVYGNQLSGQIPNLYLPALQSLVLSFNNFSGDLPNIANSTGFFSPPNVYIQNNNFNFNNLLGKLLIQGTGTVVYAPQNKYTLTNTGGLLTMNIGSAVGDPSVTYNWYRNGVLIKSSSDNTHRPFISGDYTCIATHATLTITSDANKNLGLESNSFNFVGITKSDGGRDFPAGMNDCLISAFNQLEKIYDAAGGANWTNKTNWFTNPNLSTWYGVTMSGCDVTSINLENNNLVGTIPNLSLPELAFLSFNNNRLTGSIPNFTFPKMSIMGLENNQLSGTIPNFNFPNLTYLALYNNQLTGNIPPFNSLNLSQLYVHNNQLSGDIPNFGALINFTIQNNKFIFDDMDGKTWMNTPNLTISPQLARTISFSNCDMTVDAWRNTNPIIFVRWFRNGTYTNVSTNTYTVYRPTLPGTYTCEITHSLIPDLVLQGGPYEITELNPTVSLSVSPSSVLQLGQTPTFTATITNGGTNPQYQWFVNNVLLAAGYSPQWTVTTLNNGDIVQCRIAADNPCITPTILGMSNSIKMTVCSGVPRLYVKPVATGTGDGTSWGNAMGSLQAALDFGCDNTEIWVAGGTYKPSKDPFGNTSPTDPRDKAFYLKNGFKIYGSFAGTETELSQRTPSVIAANPTILSGDFNGDNTFTGAGSTLSMSGRGEDAYHVVLSISDNNTTLLDGFIITGGYANGAGTITVEGRTIHRNSGGGFYQSFASTSISNTIFISNVADYGAGLYTFTSSPLLLNCVFDRNLANLHGGGLMCTSASYPIFKNSLFYGNKAVSVGGAVYNLAIGNPTFINTTFTVNSAQSSTGIIFNDGSATTIQNGILWGNTPAFPTASINSGTTIATYSVVENSSTGTGNVFTNPLFVDINNPLGADNKWFTSDDGLRLGCGSPAFNSGSNINTHTTDIIGNARFVHSTVDMGAYESTKELFFSTAIAVGKMTCNTINVSSSATSLVGISGYAWSGGTTPSVASNVFSANGTYTVSVTNTDNCVMTKNVTLTLPTPQARLYVNVVNTSSTQDGLSWATAFNDLQTALETCITTDAEIWVAKGTYKPSVNRFGESSPSDNRTKTFLITGNIKVYGGFAGTESNLSERTPSVIAANPSILSGDFNGNDVVLGNGGALSINGFEENAYNVVVVTSSGTTRLDGFTISGGCANLASNYADYGGGVLCLNGGNFTLTNCILTKNAANYGGGLSNVGITTSTQILNSVFERNFAFFHGASVANYLSSTSTFNNCVFSGGYALQVGGVIYNNNSTNILNNCTLIGNAAALSYGASLYNDVSRPVLTNCILWANQPTTPFVSYLAADPEVSHSIVQGGFAGTNNLNADPLFANIDDPDGADNQWFTSDDGLYLTCGSPAFNTGTNTTLTTDILKNNRTLFSTTDRGAYENTVDLTIPTVTISGATTGCTSVTLTVNATPALGVGGTYTWTGGITPSSASNTFTTSGTYTVTVTTSAGCSTSQSTSVTLDVVNRLYVNVANTNTTKDGKTWNTAFTDLQEALTGCIAAGGEIWVAKGTYKPSKDLAGNTPTNARNKTFLIPNGIKLYGGFTGTESNLSERHPSFVGAGSILSGDFNGNDAFTGNGSTLSLTNINDNAYHVVTINTPSVATVLNGFTITGGNAADATGNFLINGDDANSKGAGIFIRNGGTNVTIENCILTKNSALIGGAIANYASSPTIANCIFDKNSTTQHGAGIFNYNGSSPLIQNCVFEGNKASIVGSAIYNLLNATLTCTNATFNNNAAVAGTIYNDGSVTNLKNSIIWNSTGSVFDAFNGGSATATYSIIQGSSVYTGIGNSNANPSFKNTTDADGADNIWRTADDGLSLNCSSPAYNAGNNTGVSVTDILGNTRTQFATVDIGAYESTIDLVANAVPVPTISGETTACVTTTLTVNTVQPLGVGGTYLWSGGTTPSVSSNTFTTSGTYTVIVTDAIGCTAITAATVTINPLPVITITGETAACTKVYLNASGGATYTWSGGETPSVSSNSFITNGTYTVTVTTALNCFTTQNVTVTLGNPLNATRIYVNAANVNTTKDGLTWATAFSNLQDALDLCLSENTEIWVAHGTYRPTKDAFGNTSPSDNRNKTFYVKNKVKIYGGFVGTELNLSERTPSVNATILSGDLNNDDVVTGSGIDLFIANNSENAYHVFVAVSQNAANLIDGLMVKGGNATGSSQYILETKQIYANSGGGLYQNNCAVPLNNVVFLHNSANLGGGLYCDKASPTVTNCVFDKNTTVNHGAAALNISASAPQYINCLFTGGRAYGVAGAVYNLLSSTATFKNCTFFGNQAVAFGGVIYNDASTSTITNSIIWGNTTSGLYGGFNGGLVTVAYSITQGSTAGTGNSASDPLFINSSDPDGTDNIWGTADDGLRLGCGSPAFNTGINTGAPSADISGTSRPQFTTTDMGSYESEVDFSTAAILGITGATTACVTTNLTANLSHPSGSVVTYAWSGGETPSVASNTFTTSGTYSITATNSYGCRVVQNINVTLNPLPNITVTGATTACVVYLTAAGGSTYAWSGGETPSVATNSFSTSGTYTVTVTTAAGCSATQSSTISVTGASRIYVDAANTNAIKDGLTWATAFTDIQSALTSCIINGGEIWVAKGIYKPTHDSYGTTSSLEPQNRTFYLKNSLKLYGGFAGTEMVLSERTASVIAANPTILSGDLRGDDVVTGTGSTLSISNTSDNVNHVVLSVNDDATTLIDGFTIKGGNAVSAGIYLIEGRTIPSSNGGGICLGFSNITISKCIFVNNSGSFGGGLTCNGSSPMVNNCVFERNATSLHGAAVLNQTSAAPVFNNCIFTGNRAYQVGGAFYNVSSVTLQVKNSTFFGNTAVANGGVIYNDGSTTSLTNSIIWGNIGSGNFGSFNSGTANATYSIIEGGYTGTGNTGDNPLYLNDTDPDGADNIWGTADDGLRFNCGSPAYNGGTNTGIPSMDIRGISRPQLTTTDIGAYESEVDFSTAAQLTISGETMTCGSTTITAALTHPSGSTATYTWSSGATPSVASNTFNASGTYAITATNSIGCQATQNATVTINPLPTIIISGATSSCDVVSLTASGGSTYLWSGGATPSVASNSFTTGGNYIVTVTSAAGCLASKSVTVSITGLLSKVYVNATNTNITQDGLTWATAFTDLQSALSACLADNAEIWVAKGLYKPTQDPSGNINPTDPRDKTFYLKNKIKLYGGFVGAETELSQRTPSLIVANPTILSGDFNENDNGFANNTENAYHVLISVSDDNTTVLDGFTIQGGNANGFGTITVEAKDLGRGNGGGLYNHATSPTIVNCIFKQNSAGLGGAIFNESTSSATFSKSVFTGNQGSYGGVGFNGTGSAPLFINVILHNNMASQLGGGFYHQFASPSFMNCTFSNSPTHNEASALTITNSILTGSGINNPNGALTITYTNGSGVAGIGNSSNSPEFINASDPDGADNIWGTADDGLRLACNSPLRDAGINTDAPTVDFTSSDIFNTLKDLGAYEKQDNNGCPIYESTTTCQSTTINNVSGNRLYNFFINNQLVAVLNPNGQNLGNVTVEVGSPNAIATFNGIKHFGRGINITSTVAPTTNYTLCLFYKNTELTEFRTAVGSSVPRENLNMTWRSGGSSGCNLGDYNSTSTGIISSGDISNVDYGIGNDGFYLQFNLNHFTIFSPSVSAVLPVELLTFEGRHTEGGNLLIWKTATEINTSHFDIEVSTDGRNFIKIGEVKAKGSSSDYQFLDNKSTTGFMYYRLKINDLDNNVTFSKVIVLELKNSSTNKIKVYPNPVDSYLTIEMGEINQDVLILNAIGQVLLRQNTQGFKQLTVDVSHFLDGIYFIKSGKEIIKFIKN